MSSRATAYKDKGNVQFQNGEYEAAVKCYTQAIQCDAGNSKLFTNRAMAHIKLEHWEESLSDSLHAIDLEPKSMKGFYYLAQSQLNLRRPNEAYCSALTAYERCRETLDKSMAQVSGLVMTAKKERWLAKEKQRLRDRNELLRDCEDGFARSCREELETLEYLTSEGSTVAEQKKEIRARWTTKRNELLSVFAVADSREGERREVPDYLIDSITFAVMHDPVMTKTGTSYDRATLIEHLKRSNTDPLTREPLTLADLRPNLALKQACEVFLNENGWAVDY